jgi:hypothetical protein
MGRSETVATQDLRHPEDRRHTEMEADARAFVRFVAVMAAGALTMVLISTAKWLVQ